MIFSGSYEKTSAVITGKSIVSESSGNVTVPQSVVGRVRKLPGVAEAAGAIFDLEGASDKAQLIGRDGKTISQRRLADIRLRLRRRPDALQPHDPDRGPLGRERRRGRHRPGHRRLGGLRGRRKSRRRGDRPDSPFHDHGDREVRLGAVPGRRDDRRLHRRRGAAPARQEGTGRPDLRRRQAGGQPERGGRPNPAGAAAREPRSGPATEQAEDNAADVNEFIQIIRYILLAFAGIAVLVGAFVTFNTLSITVAQRIREFATLRSLGASRRQVLRSVLIEGFCIGVLASVIGLFAGLGLAKGLNAVFDASSSRCRRPASSLETRTWSSRSSLGTLTMVCRPGAGDPGDPDPADLCRARGRPAPPARLARAAPRSSSWSARSGSACWPTGARDGVGAARLFAIGLWRRGRVPRGRARLVPRSSGRWPARSAPPARRLAARRRVARRQRGAEPGPHRRAAAALMVGLTLVTVVAARRGPARVGHPRRREAGRAAYVVTSANGFDTLPARGREAHRRGPGVTPRHQRPQRQGRAAGAEIVVTGVDPAASAASTASTGPGIRPVVAGRGSMPARCVDEGLRGRITTSRWAAAFTLRTASGSSCPCGSRDPRPAVELDPLFGSVHDLATRVRQRFRAPLDLFTFLDTGGAHRRRHRGPGEALRPFPDASVLTKDGWVEEPAGGIDDRSTCSTSCSPCP